MPGTKSRTRRRRKQKPPKRAVIDTSRITSAEFGPTMPGVSPSASVHMCDTSLTSSTASQSKLCFDTSMDSDKDGEEDMDIIGEGRGHTLLELAGLQLAIQQAACCNVCGTG